MGTLRQRARFDWLVELGGASALGACGGYAGLKLAPSFALPGATVMTAAGFGLFAAGMLTMRRAQGGPAAHHLPEFAVAPVESDELLLDMPVEEPLLLDTPYEAPLDDDVLLLEDPLPQADPASRVVRLFASASISTPGELKDRIDRHLAGEPSVPADGQPMPNHASDALYAALDELRRSLR